MNREEGEKNRLGVLLGFLNQLGLPEARAPARWLS